MLGLNFYRYLKNYLTVRVYGGFIERFINLCNAKNIYLWDMVYEDNGITVKIYCKDFFKLREIRAKSGVSVKIISKNGLHYFFKEHSDRKGILYGIILGLIFMLTMNFFVWSIETQGSKKLSDEEIFSVAESLGLKIGAFTPFLDRSDISREAVNLFNGEVLWLSINIKGSKAVIEVRDFVKPSAEENERAACNLVADSSGIIIEAQTNSGNAYATVGSAVKEGDLLISGISENEDGSVNYLFSDGVFSVLHDKHYENSFNQTEKYMSLTDTESYSKLRFLNFVIPLSFSAFSSEKEKLQYELKGEYNGNVLPVGVIKTVQINRKSEVERKNELLYCIDRYTENEYRELKNTLIIDCDYKISLNGSTVNVGCDYNCIDFIGVQKAIIKEN